MAYHFAVKPLGMATASAVHRAAYQARTELHDDRHDRHTRDYAHKGDLAFLGGFIPKDAPDDLRDLGAFWNAAEKAERQADGRPARDFELALPNQLSRKAQIALVTDFAREQFMRKGFGAWAALHSDHGEDGQARPGRDPAKPRNDHVHMMVSTRRIGADGFARTKTGDRDMNSREQLQAWRETWAKQCAKALRRAGHEQEAARWEVGHLTLDKQREAALARGDTGWAAALDRDPDVKLGAKSAAQEARGVKTERGNRRRDIQARNQERAEVRAEVEIVDRALARHDRDERDARRQAAVSAAKLAKIDARQQATARGAMRAAAIRLREVKEQRQDMQARHDAAYVGRQGEWQRFREDREAGRKAVAERFQHAIDRVWNPEPGAKQASPDMSAWQQVSEQMTAREMAFRDREQRLTGRIVNAIRLARAGKGSAMRLALRADERRQAFEREQRRFYAEHAPKAPKVTITHRPNTPSPKSWQSARLKQMRREALAEYDRETKAGAKAMQARHQFQRRGETAEKAAMRQAQAEAGAAMDAAKALRGEAKPEQREATTGRPVAGKIDARAEKLTMEAAPAFRGKDTGKTSEAPQRPSEGKSEHDRGGAGDPATGKPDRPETTWTRKGQAEDDRAREAEAQPPPQPDEAQRQAEQQKQAEQADREALERLLARYDADRQAQIDELREWREARDAASRESGGRERGR